jgi:hypothetical protein
MCRLSHKLHAGTGDKTTTSGKLLAWIEPGEEETVVAAFVGSGARDRLAATQTCSTHDEARKWVETEAEAIGVPVEWV